MDDRHVGIEPVDVPEVVVAGGDVKVRVAHIEAHADIRLHLRIVPAETGEEPVEVLGPGVDRVFNGQADTLAEEGTGQQDKGICKSFDPLVEAQVDVQQLCAYVDGKI